MNDDLHISDIGAHLVQHFEGCLKPDGNGMFRAYKCPAESSPSAGARTNEGQTTLTHLLDGRLPNVMRRLKTIWCRLKTALRKLVKVPLNQWQFDAL